MAFPIRVIPPQEGFLLRVAEEILANEGDQLSKATVVFPTRRAGLYFRYYLHRLRPETKPLPRLFGIADLLNELAVKLDPRPLIPRADQAWLLWEMVKERRPFLKVAESFDRFFPWGLRLSEILDQLEQELVEAQNIVYPPEEDLPPEARELLEDLGDIQQAFRQRLLSLGAITSGQRWRLLAEHIEELSFPEGPLYLVGFFMLTQAEMKIFKAWLKQGARLFWEADPEDLPEVFERQRRYFGVELEGLSSSRPSPRVSFYEAPDVHHELTALKDLLPHEINAPDEALILLCVAGHLIPLLYELPEGLPVNVTLGYPLRRTTLAHLLELFLTLEESRQGERYHVPAYLRLLKHPYLKGLKGPGETEARLVFHLLEERLRDRGSPYLSLSEIENLLEDEPDQLFGDISHRRAFLSWFHRELISPWAEIKTPRQLAEVIRRTIYRLLLPRLSFLKEVDSPEVLLERAFLYTLEAELLPNLEQVSFADFKLRSSTLFNFLRELLRNLRAPFEGEPLEGLQVMGLLETRLLRFKKVFVLDANEGDLPSVEEVNPLLPEAVKPLLGLPPREREEVIERYHFFRLVGAAEEVHLFYQSAVSGKGETLGKKMRSRYIERLMWEEEKREGRLLPEKIKHIELKLSPKSFARKEAIPKGESENRYLSELIFSKNPGLSASLLNAYLFCPAKFYHQYLLGLSPTKTVAEFDAAELGNIVHEALEEYFKPYIGRHYLPLQDNQPERLAAIFERRFRASALYHRLGPERRFFIEETARFRLTRYLNHLKSKPEGFIILALEVPRHKDWKDLRLFGRIDRVEVRGERVFILDYKTGGSVKTLGPTAFRERLKPYEPPATFGPEELFELAEILPDLQLFFYLLLWEDRRPKDAAFIQLAAGQEDHLEKSIFYNLPWEEAHEFLERRFPRIMEYILEHMLRSKAFFATKDSGKCRFCDYRLACPCAR